MESRTAEVEPEASCQPESEISIKRWLHAVSQARGEPAAQANWPLTTDPLTQTIVAKEVAAILRRARRDVLSNVFISVPKSAENRFRQAFA